MLGYDALLHSVDLDLPEPLHHHVDAQRQAKGLDDVLEVKQRDVADNAAGRKEIRALHGLEFEESFFKILEDVHELTRVG